MPPLERTCVRCGMRLPIAAFGPNARGRDGLNAACRACNLEQRNVWKHGMTSLQKAQLAAANGGCSTCGRIEPGKKGWVIDHDHSCCPGDQSCESCRRGVLCQWCNNALGYAGDDPRTLRRLADYLELGTRIGR